MFVERYQEDILANIDSAMLYQVTIALGVFLLFFGILFLIFCLFPKKRCCFRRCREEEQDHESTYQHLMGEDGHELDTFDTPRTHAAKMQEAAARQTSSTTNPFSPASSAPTYYIRNEDSFDDISEDEETERDRVRLGKQD